MNANLFATILIFDGYMTCDSYEPTRYSVGINGREIIVEDSLSFGQSYFRLIPIINELRQNGFTRIAVGINGPYPTAIQKVKDIVAQIPGVEFVSNWHRDNIVITRRYKGNGLILMNELGHRRSKF